MNILRLIVFLPAMLLAAPDSSIDPARSELIIHVGKAGVFSAVGHEHWVNAPISHGQFQEGSNPRVEFAVDARKMAVRPDAKTSPADLATIQETMQSSVLESAKYPEIRFRSTQVTPVEAQAWRVTGALTLHGVSKSITADVHREGNVYAGTARLLQTDFDIQPVRIAGGIVRVKNQLDISFRIRAQEGQ